MGENDQHMNTARRLIVISAYVVSTASDRRKNPFSYLKDIENEEAAAKNDGRYF